MPLAFKFLYSTSVSPESGISPTRKHPPPQKIFPGFYNCTQAEPIPPQPQLDDFIEVDGQVWTVSELKKLNIPILSGHFGIPCFDSRDNNGFED